MKTWNGIKYEVFDDILARHNGNINIAIRDSDDALKRKIIFAYYQSHYLRLEKYNHENMPDSLAERLYPSKSDRPYNEREGVKALMFFKRELTSDELFPDENLSEASQARTKNENFSAQENINESLWVDAIANAKLAEKKMLYAMYHRAKNVGWKEIADHFEVEERTAQRWIENGKGEKLRQQKGLPLI